MGNVGDNSVSSYRLHASQTQQLADANPSVIYRGVDRGQPSTNDWPTCNNTRATQRLIDWYYPIIRSSLQHIWDPLSTNILGCKRLWFCAVGMTIAAQHLTLYYRLDLLCASVNRLTRLQSERGCKMRRCSRNRQRAAPVETAARQLAALKPRLSATRMPINNEYDDNNSGSSSSSIA